jgi:matrixin
MKIVRQSVRTWTHLAAAGLLVLLLAAPAGAYCIKTYDGANVRWALPINVWFLGNKSFSDPAYLNAFNAARNRWNESPTLFTVQTSYPVYEVDMGNEVNEVWFSTDQTILAGAPGLTLTWRSGAQIVETDIVFDANWGFTPGTTKSDSRAYGGAFRTFRTVALHEMGHALGLCHNKYSYNIMGDDRTFVHANGNTLRPYQGASGIAGLMALYGFVPNSHPDFSVSHWKYGGNDGEYSTHVRTKVYDASSNAALQAVACGANNAEPCFKVSKGQTVRVEFTTENLSGVPQTVGVEYRLSTNDTISSADRLLGSGTISNLSGIDTGKSFPLTIPTDLTSGGFYWIGTIVNPGNDPVESTTANNATYIGIYVQ